MASGGNTDIYRVSVSGGGMTRLTTSPGIDTGGSYSPDGSKIVFESDRGGSQQLYVMNADGSGQQRISFGDGRYRSVEPPSELRSLMRLSYAGFSLNKKITQ